MIDFTPLNNRSNIWVSVSGGTDSALLLYLIAKYLYDTQSQAKITPWCYVDDSRPGNDLAVKRIIDAVSKRVDYKIEELIVDHFYKHPGGDKVALTKPFWDQHADSGNYDLYATALSAAPPLEDMQSNPEFYKLFKQVGPEDRLSTGTVVSYDNKHKMVVWKPFINLNKKNLAQVYDEEDLMDDLFPLTESCVGRSNTPCYNCFWCYEKHWAFGMYDINRRSNPL
jgi:hypothetical protein